MIVATLFGCVPTRYPSYGWHGQEPILAIYQGKTLHSELPEHIAPGSVRAAAERVLRSRGYTITTSEATEDRTRVVARPPDARLFKRVIVGSSLSRGGTRVGVTIEPGGNETTARDMLESILTLLGH
ncbi:MAG: hypothetical protein D6695_07115 [Planctomycetota bacterium]|nr:MAG: hypothetical protein D6695_07115 [Planctomycetota bacterium]